MSHYQKSDADAFRLFYQRNSKLIYNYILSSTRNQSDADDAMQETFLRVHRYVHRFDPTQSALGWTFQIARNVMIDLFHKKKKNDFEEEESGVSGDNPQQSIAAKQELERLIKKLNPDERTLLVQRFVENDSFENIAKNLGTTPTNARQKLSRLLRKLREN